MPSKDSFLPRRSAGVLLPVSALPSGSDIGTFGEGARLFIDALFSAGVEFWQILPLNIAGKGNSPYSSPSAFAISPLYFDQNQEIIPGAYTDYRKARRKKINTEDFDYSSPDFLRFCQKNEFWLEPFVKFSGGGKEIGAVQYLVRNQWDSLKAYANSKGVKIIGDLPIYVSAVSADVKANPSLFAVGKDFTPLSVAGVPPDIFSSDGQLWGNPIYNWTAHKNTDFRWWIKRLEYSLELFDYIRIDHFRAFSSYYSIPYGSKTAKAGVWEYAPGRELFSKAKEKLGKMNIIAEDLGLPTPDVAELLRFTGFPGMKILQFGFSGDKTNPFKMQNHPACSVCYTGTHDNDTTAHWYDTLTEDERAAFNEEVPKYGGLPPAHRLIRYGAESKSELFIIPAQDLLNLGAEARFNAPSTEHGNWEWRISKEQISELPEIIKELLPKSDRIKPPMN